MTPAQTIAWLGLMSLPEVGARRLWAVLAGGDPVDDWRRVQRGLPPRSFPSSDAERRTWRTAAPAIVAAAPDLELVRVGASLTVWGDGLHPPVEHGDPHVPPVLVWAGRPGCPTDPARPRVGIVGTRRASRYGIDLAAELGAALAGAGCTVVSGLAAGIDAAAHRGALSVGSPDAALGVVGTGVDVPYPRQNSSLWADVVANGAVVSAHPPGTPPARWRFPARNRILAALSDVLVVVESHERGGALITAGVAGERGVPVLAVPGPVRSSGSVGANRLIADGCQPCLAVDDVLDALALVGRPAVAGAAAGFVDAGGAMASGASAPAGTRSPVEASVLEALGWSGRRSFDDLAEHAPDHSVAQVARALAGLVASGDVEVADGWYERRARGRR